MHRAAARECFSLNSREIHLGFIILKASLEKTLLVETLNPYAQSKRGRASAILQARCNP
jgi:hypothetical protein